MDLTNIYSLRQRFTVVGLTGRTGSGLTTIAKQLGKGFVEDEDIYPKPKVFNHNSYRKYRIVYDFAKENFKPFKVLFYKDILTAFIFKEDFNDLIGFLNSAELREEFEKSKLNVECNFDYEIAELQKLKDKFNVIQENAEEVIVVKRKTSKELEKLHEFYYSDAFEKLNVEFHEAIGINSRVKRNKILQVIANNLRKSGQAFEFKKTDAKNIFTITELLNDVIKSIRKKMEKEGLNAEIVIDSLRNPFEIMFFRQRFSAFYSIAVNREDKAREAALEAAFGKGNMEDINKLIIEEHKGGKSKDFYHQNVAACIQQADIHISFRTTLEAKELNDKRVETHNDYTSPYFTWGMQLLKYISLIDSPGLVTPSPEERCMQMAYTAKYNSGCISRQVGASVTDMFYSIKAIGWNNTPEGHVPCKLRNTEDLLNDGPDLDAFTPFEKNREGPFRKALENNYVKQIESQRNNLKGRTICFCFKDLHNSYAEGKNQVHTRSLHAEESAFLQITKYGGVGIQGGKLFTTASPCELCSKKAYQLGIKVIYYIDPYPGISMEQILEAGVESRNPEMRLFNGAIGNAYHWLYEPIMPYKDELKLILEHEISDLTKSYEKQIQDLKKEIEALKSK